MIKFVSIASGSALGAGLRFFCQQYNFSLFHGLFSAVTLVNLLGSFGLVLVMTIAIETNFSPEMRSGICIGFFGAFTTFSAFCGEAFLHLLQSGWSQLMLYIFLHLVLCLAAAWLGHLTGRAALSVLDR